jgi:outer membrane protein OmpA-like peptidoglycan-associated protein
MTIRSKLFATVALPVLSISVAITPALADSLTKPFEVAQEEGIAQPDGGEAVPEELLRKKRKKNEQAEEQQAPQQEQPAAEEEQPSRAERRKQRQDAEQQQEQPQQRDAQPAEEEQPSRSERRKKREKEAEQPQEQPQQDAQPAEEEQPSRSERRKKREQEAEQKQAEEPQQDQAQPSGDDEAAKAAEERAKARAERKKSKQDADQAEPKPEEVQPSADDEAAKAAEERAKARAERRKKSQQTEEQQTEEAQPSGDDEAARKAEEDRARAEGKGEQQTEQPAEDGELRPALDGDADADTARKPRDRREPVPEIVDTRTKEEKQEIARDPAKSDETVVLPVENGAAVLDSDKDADNASGGEAREKRRKQRERMRADDENVEVPKSDAEAQSRRRDRRPSEDEIRAAIKEDGRRVERAPEFGIPDLIDAFTGNDRRRPRIDETGDDRVVLDFGDRIIVRGDDRPRLRRNAERSFYEELSGGRTRETIERRNGVQIVTIYNRYGDIVQRSRIDRDGREYVMIYAPESDDGPRPPAYDVGQDLPPMRLRVPVQDYIIDTSSQPDRDYYDFLAEPPVEQVERVYTIDEVRSSARIRDKVRRIDLDTITFATNSAEVPLSQAKTLRKVADAMLEVIDKDPGETFLIEGHTDAVGGDQPNLVLSDERAESVASLLTEVYDIPAENLVTQGYGERFLKVRTPEAEQENRRVTIRRVTPLVRPVAQN